MAPVFKSPLIDIKLEERYLLSSSFWTSSEVILGSWFPFFISRKALFNNGRCALTLACVKEHHSELFQNHKGTWSG